MPARLDLFVTSPDRSLAFYRGILGLPLVSTEGAVHILDLGGTRLRLRPVILAGPGGPFGAPGFLPTCRVESLEVLERSLTEQGVAFRRFDDGLLAFDPDGNGILLVE